MKKKDAINQILDFVLGWYDSDRSSIHRHIGNCEIMVHLGSGGNNSDTTEIHLANSLSFDRWANSRSIVLYPAILAAEGTLKEVLKRAIEIYE
jgi:hypothetical protein